MVHKCTTLIYIYLGRGLYTNYLTKGCEELIR